MSILFVLLTFLLIMSITYFLRREQPAAAVQPRVYRQPPAPNMTREQGFDVPKGYCFHPGHTWVLDEGRQNARIGLDSFGATLLGRIDRVEVVGLNRWVRQGQKICTLSRDGLAVELLSPIEGVVVSVNQDVVNDPGIVLKDPYKEGWICVVKAPEINLNLNNLLQGSLVGSWMQNSVRRLSTMTSQLGEAAAADGGLPVAGLLAQLEPGAQRAMIREFFLT
ncbi:MAG: glycine cleavage system protein H [Terriglobales bacterium]